MNKKKKIALIILLFMAVFLVGFIVILEKHNDIYDDKLPGKITSHSWKRDGSEDIETIYFNDDGSFGYYCSCGNAVDNYDLCDSYKYDEDTKTIKLNCSQGVKVNKIKILEVSETKLILDFKGEKREFITEYSHLIENPLLFAGLTFKSVSKDFIVLKFTKEGSYDAYNSAKGGYVLGADTCFNWKYNDENKEIMLDCQDEIRTIKINRYDPETKEIELYFQYEDETITFVENSK